MTAQKPGLRSLLLSPPSSPRMSSYAAELSGRTEWHHHRDWHQPVPSHDRLPLLLNESSSDQHLADPRRAPVPQSHKSDNAERDSPLQGQSHTPDHHKNTTTEAETSHRHTFTRTEPALTLATRKEQPSSPTPQLTTPTSPINDQKVDFDDSDIIADLEVEDEDVGVGDGKTAAERRAEKRKMKRFRLTHNQTRFLMSEFTRQAHPDAARREQLSREIPGLSPRQVQVWFQNRRAKMKRLTMDDQERMLRSRALPEDFNVAQTLHTSYDGQALTSTPLTSPANYVPAYGETSFGRPYMANELRGQSDDGVTSSPFSLQSTYGGSVFTPFTSDNVSPTSTASDRHFTAPSHHHASPRNMQFFGKSGSVSGYNSPKVPRLQHPSAYNRARAESLQSPLRSSMSYSSQPQEANEDRFFSAGAVPGSRVETSDTPYRRGYQNVPPYDPTSTVNRPRPIPPGLQLKSDYHGASSTNLSALRMQSAPLAPPPEYHSPQLSAPYYSTSFGNTPSTQQSNEPSTSHLPSMNSAYHASDEPAPPQRYMQPPPQHYTSHDGNQGSINFGLPRRSFTYGPGSVQQ